MFSRALPESALPRLVSMPVTRPVDTYFYKNARGHEIVYAAGVFLLSITALGPGPEGILGVDIGVGSVSLDKLATLRYVLAHEH